MISGQKGESAMSKFIATLVLDDSVLSDPEQNVNDHSSLGYVEEELGWIEQSGISVESIKQLDDKTSYKKYMSYLVDWIFEHSNDENPGASPLSYDQWLNGDVNNYPVRIMDVNQFAEEMNYPDCNDMIVIAVDKVEDENEDHIHVIAYFDGDYDTSVLEPVGCYLDSFCRDNSSPGSVWDYIARFKANYTQFSGDEPNSAEKALLYLRDACLDSSMVIHRADKCLILRNEELDELLSLPSGVYLVGVK